MVAWSRGADTSSRQGLIIRLIIQTIRRDPSGAVWTDEPSNVSRLDPSGAVQADCEHPSRNRKVVGSNPTSGSKTPGQRAFLASPTAQRQRAVIPLGLIIAPQAHCPASLRRCAARLPAGSGSDAKRRNAVGNVGADPAGGRSWAARFMRLRRHSHIHIGAFCHLPSVSVGPASSRRSTSKGTASVGSPGTVAAIRGDLSRSGQLVGAAMAPRYHSQLQHPRRACHQHQQRAQ